MATNTYGEIKTSGTAGNVLTENSSGPPTFQPAGGGASGTIPNTVSTIPQRDSTSGLFFGRPSVTFDGTTGGGTYSVTFAQSNAVLMFTGTTGNPGIFALPTLSGTQVATYTVMHAGTAGVLLTVNTGAFSAWANNSTTGAGNLQAMTMVVSTSPNSTITFTGRVVAGTTTWMVESFMGAWQDGNATPLAIAPPASFVSNASATLQLSGYDGGVYNNVATATTTLPTGVGGSTSIPGVTYTFIKTGTNAYTIACGNGKTIKWNNAGTVSSATTSISTSQQYASVTMTLIGSTFIVTAITGTWTFT